MAFKESLLKILNLDMVASEIVRALSGSIGMLTVIPITAVVSGWLFGHFERKPKDDAAVLEGDYWESLNNITTVKKED
jgi:uncharacterized membrane protein